MSLISIKTKYYCNFHLTVENCSFIMPDSPTTWLGTGGGVKRSIIGRVIFPINKMCGVSFENKRVTVCFFVCVLVFFFLQGSCF